MSKEMLCDSAVRYLSALNDRISTEIDNIDGNVEVLINNLAYEGSTISIYKYENGTVSGPTNGKGYLGA